MRPEHVEAAIKTVVVYFGKRHARDVFERRPPVPMFRDPQLRTLRAKPRDREHRSDVGPWDFLLPRLDERADELAQPEPMPQCKAQPHLAKIAHPLHAQRSDIGGFPLRRRLRRRRLRRPAQPGLTRLFPQRPPFEQSAEILPARFVGELGGIEFAQRRDHALTRPAGRAVRFAQRPVIVVDLLHNLAVTA